MRITTSTCRRTRRRRFQRMLSITDNQGEGTIENNTDVAEITIDDVSQAEDAGNAIFTVSLSNPVSVDVTVALATQDGRAQWYRIRTM